MLTSVFHFIQTLYWRHSDCELELIEWKVKGWTLGLLEVLFTVTLIYANDYFFIFLFSTVSISAILWQLMLIVFHTSSYPYPLGNLLHMELPWGSRSSQCFTLWSIRITKRQLFTVPPSHVPTVTFMFSLENLSLLCQRTFSKRLLSSL